MIKAILIGDYDKTYIHHLNTNNALLHASKFISVDIDINWIHTLDVSEEKLKEADLIWCAPGSPYKSMEGALEAIRYAREHNIPFIGTCGGFQHTVIEYARNVLGFDNAQHAEYDPAAKTLFITPLVCSVKGQALEVMLTEGSLTFNSYNKQKVVREQFHCQYGLNPEYRAMFNPSNLKIAGLDNNDEVRVLELNSNDFFIATLFLPQSLSTEADPHPLILQLLKAADNYRKKRITIL